MAYLYREEDESANTYTFTMGGLKLTVARDLYQQKKKDFTKLRRKLEKEGTLTWKGDYTRNDVIWEVDESIEVMIWTEIEKIVNLS